MKFNVASIVEIGIALFVLSIILPLALTQFVSISTGNATLDTILTTLIPTIAGISVVAGLVSYYNKN